MTKIQKTTQSNNPTHWVIDESQLVEKKFGLLVGNDNNQLKFVEHEIFQNWLEDIGRIGSDYCETTGHYFEIKYFQFLPPEDWSERDQLLNEFLDLGGAFISITPSPQNEPKEERALLNMLDKIYNQGGHKVTYLEDHPEEEELV